MSIVRYSSSLNDFVPTTFSNIIDRFFEETASRSGGSAYSFVPRVDVFENDNAYELQVAVPGVNKEDFKLDLNENLLTISGERKFTHDKQNKNFRSIETQFGTFKRTFSLPEHVDASKINAKYVNGILEVVVPKDEKKIIKASIKVN